MHITAQGCRLRNDLYCVEWDVKLYYTIPEIHKPWWSTAWMCPCADRHSGASEEVKKMEEKKFKDIGEAYSVLSDAKKKARYDSGQDLDESGMEGFGSEFSSFFLRHLYHCHHQWWESTGTQLERTNQNPGFDNWTEPKVLRTRTDQNPHHQRTQPNTSTKFVFFATSSYHLLRQVRALYMGFSWSSYRNRYLRWVSDVVYEHVLQVKVR